MLGSQADPYRILVVDDHQPIRDLLQKTLENMGYEVIPARNGKEALVFFLRETFHLVITDLNMPEGDGSTLASSVKNVAPETPVVIMTGSPWNLGSEIPVDTVMEKPFSLNAFRDTVKDFCRFKGL